MTERDPMSVAGVQGSTPRVRRDTPHPRTVVAPATRASGTMVLFDDMATTKRPFWLHRCRAALAGVDSGMYVERCACGAIRMNRRTWIERNTARKAK